MQHFLLLFNFVKVAIFVVAAIVIAVVDSDNFVGVVLLVLYLHYVGIDDIGVIFIGIGVKSSICSHMEYIFLFFSI